jgi:hypothetical protein
MQVIEIQPGPEALLATGAGDETRSHSSEVRTLALLTRVGGDILRRRVAKMGQRIGGSCETHSRPIGGELLFHP